MMVAALLHFLQWTSDQSFFHLIFPISIYFPLSHPDHIGLPLSLSLIPYHPDRQFPLVLSSG